MKLFSEIIAERLQHKGLKSEAYASLIIEHMRIILSDNFTENIFQFCTVQKYYKKKIFIATKSSTWKHKLNAHTSSFLTLIQAEFPHEKIDKIIIL